MSTWPQWVYAGLIAFNVTAGMYKAGKSQDGGDAVVVLLAAATATTILYFGGFWAPFGFVP